MRRRFKWLGLAVALGALATAASGYKGLESYRLGAELEASRRAIAGRQFEAARARLLRLEGRGGSEGDYLLGLAEEGLGHEAEALAAWSRVRPGSAFAGRAAARRLAPEFRRGHWRAVEELAPPILGRPDDPDAIEACRTLAATLMLEGRMAEAATAFRVGFDRLPAPEGTLLRLWKLTHHPFPAEIARPQIEAAEQGDPDDRVALAWANLALQLGRLDEARDRLDGGLQARPDDPALWRARLDWARARRDAPEVRRALDHLPDAALSRSEVAALRAWSAALRGNRDAERRALEEQVALEPGAAGAVDRLAALAALAGEADRAARLRDRKAGLDQARARYETLITTRTPAVHATELARMAETLGLRFEARAWARLALRRDPRDREARALRDRIGRVRLVDPATAEDLAALRAEFGPAMRATSEPGTIAGRTAPAFVDDAAASGLRFAYEPGRLAHRDPPEMMGGGLALLDFDGDGWLDVYCVQGGNFPPGKGRRPNRDRLFRNQRDGHFEDVTTRAGLDRLPGGYGYGVAVGDFDNDGFPDLFLTRWRSYALYRNKGDGTFEDVTDAAGLGGDRDWPTSAAFADLDGDGDLDLYVCHYLVFDEEKPRESVNARDYDVSRFSPLHYGARPDHLFRNDGGRFVDVTSESGIVDRDGRGLGVLAADLDLDGKVDLYVANDMTANFYFHNLGGLRFEEIGATSGVAAGGDGGYQAGMGIACGDLDGDGRPDLAVTNFYEESTTYYQNLGAGLFADRTAAIGLAAPTRYVLGFGISFGDVDNDGRLDLAIANGMVDDVRPSAPFAMPATLLLGTQGGRLIDVGPRAGPCWNVPRVGRGLAVGDLDNDGRLDLLISSQDVPLAYFHNRSEAGRWLTIRLEGTRSQRDAVGARVAVTAGGRRQVAQRLGGSSFASASDSRLHFGLGASDRVDEVEVRWPSGLVETFRNLAADAGCLIREGEGRPGPLRGFPRW